MGTVKCPTAVGFSAGLVLRNKNIEVGLKVWDDGLWIAYHVILFDIQGVLFSVQVMGFIVATVTDMQGTKTSVSVNTVVTNELKEKLSHLFKHLAC